jgi:hypothetical protein
MAGQAGPRFYTDAAQDQFAARGEPVNIKSYAGADHDGFLQRGFRLRLHFFLCDFNLLKKTGGNLFLTAK